MTNMRYVQTFDFHLKHAGTWKAITETWISLEEEDSDDDNCEEEKDEEDKDTDIESEEEIEVVSELF